MRKILIYIFVLIYIGPVFAREIDFVTQVSPVLSDSNKNYVPPCSDNAWRSAELNSILPNVVKKAENFVVDEKDAWSNELYKEYSINGSRLAGERMIWSQIQPLVSLVIAECYENKGRFISSLESVLRRIVDQPSWTLPAHDSNLENLVGRYSVDLNSCELSHDLAWAIKLHSNRLNPRIVGKIISALELRVFAPLRSSITSRSNGASLGHHWWIESASNWNPVCFSAVVGAAYALNAPDLDFWVDIALKNSLSYLESIGEDGYADEGPAYWNYGFGAYLRLREIILLVRPSSRDLLDYEKIRKFAVFPQDFSLYGNIAPSFGDAPQKVVFNPVIKAHAEVALGLQNVGIWSSISRRVDGVLRLNDAVWRIWGAPVVLKTRLPDAMPKNCSVFRESGVAVVRPLLGSDCINCLSFAFRLGGGRSHAHDDAGSYVLALDGVTISGDPGSPVYTSQSFGPKRRSNPFVNSFSHPVPRVNQTNQRSSNESKANWLSVSCLNRLSDISDFLVDLKPVYQSQFLQTLTRHFLFRSGNDGFLSVTDNFVSGIGIEFESPIIFRGDLFGRGELIQLRYQGKMVDVKIEASSQYELDLVPVRESVNNCVNRMAVRLKDNGYSGYIRYVFSLSPNPIEGVSLSKC